MEGVILRPPLPEDHNFICNSFLNELHDQYPFKHIDKKVFSKNQTPIIKKVINESLVLVACHKENINQIFGYCIFEKFETDTVVHFVYVKYNFRDYGIGTSLLKAVDDKFGNKDILISYLPRKMPNSNTHQTLVKYKLRYDPFVIMRRLTGEI